MDKHVHHFTPKKYLRGFTAPGEKSAWRLEYRSYFWDDRLDPWLAGLVGVAALGMVVFVYRHEGGRASMRAQGHFMDHRYTDFDAAISIEPPT